MNIERYKACKGSITEIVSNELLLVGSDKTLLSSLSSTLKQFLTVMVL